MQKVIAYYENQTEDEAVAEAEARLQDESVTLMDTPHDAKSYCKRCIANTISINVYPINIC